MLFDFLVHEFITSLNLFKLSLFPLVSLIPKIAISGETIVELTPTISTEKILSVQLKRKIILFMIYDFFCMRFMIFCY